MCLHEQALHVVVESLSAIGVVEQELVNERQRLSGVGVSLWLFGAGGAVQVGDHQVDLLVAELDEVFDAQTLRLPRIQAGVAITSHHELGLLVAELD